MLELKLILHQEKVISFCQRWQIKELALFGSVLRADFRPDSDVDVLVDFQPEVRWSLFDLVDMYEELKQIFQREVDLITRRSLYYSLNPKRSQAILSTAQVIYATA